MGVLPIRRCGRRVVVDDREALLHPSEATLGMRTIYRTHHGVARLDGSLPRGWLTPKDEADVDHDNGLSVGFPPMHCLSRAIPDSAGPTRRVSPRRVPLRRATRSHGERPGEVVLPVPQGRKLMWSVSAPWLESPAICQPCHCSARARMTGPADDQCPAAAYGLTREARVDTWVSPGMDAQRPDGARALAVVNLMRSLRSPVSRSVPTSDNSLPSTAP